MSNSFSKELGKGIALDVKVTKKQSRSLFNLAHLK